MFYLVYIILCMSCVCFAKQHPSTSQPPAPDDVTDVKLVIMGMRHGNRNPGQFLKNDPNVGKWGLEGELEVTSIGKQQAYSVGEMLRSRYGSLISPYYIPNQVKATSSSANRCQMTLQLALAGLFPPKDRSIWNNKIQWQPIPYSIDNPMLRMYAVDECQPQLDAWQPISDDNLPKLREWIQKEKPIMDYIAANTGVNATSLSDMADVADNIMNLKMMKFPMPHWIKNPTLDGYNKTTMIKKILSFAEAHQIECALDKRCRGMMAGYWLNNIYDNIQAKSKGKSKLKIIAYASHTEITMAIMREMGYDVQECPTSAGFVIEYLENGNTGAKSVRFLYHGPDPEDPVVHHLVVAPLQSKCTGSVAGNCSLAQFHQRYKSMFSIDNWKTACKIPTCDAPSKAPSTSANCGYQLITSGVGPLRSGYTFMHKIRYSSSNAYCEKLCGSNVLQFDCTAYMRRPMRMSPCYFYSDADTSQLVNSDSEPYEFYEYGCV